MTRMKSSVEKGTRILCLLALALLVPACGKTQQQGLTITDFSPTGGSVPRQLIVYISFDRALDASTWPTSFTWQDGTGTAVAAIISYNATLNQIALKPTGGALAGGMQYTVVILGTLMGADGSTFAGDAFQFTTAVATPTNGGQPSFGGLTGAAPTAAPAKASIDLTWATATDVPDGDAIQYDVYMSTVSGGQDFSLPPLVVTPNGSGVTVNAANGLASGVTYFFVVRAREATTGNIEFNTTPFSATTN